MPENLGGSNNENLTFRQATSNSVNNLENAPVDLTDKCTNTELVDCSLDETEIVHISKKNECAVMVQTGRKSLKALWDSGAAKCVLSYECYNSINNRYKTALYHSDVKIRAANGTYIQNKGECDLSFRIGSEKFTFHFLCSDQLTQGMILGHDLAKAFHIGTTWDVNDIMHLTKNGESFAETLPTRNLNALVFCAESIIIPPFSNGFIPCKLPRGKIQASLGKVFEFEPTFKHRSNYVQSKTHEGLVTMDDKVMGSGIFNIAMTNMSNRHIKIHSNQTIGMLKSCDEDQVCSIHKIITFCKKGEGDQILAENKIETKEENLYHIPWKNPKTNKIEIHTVVKKEQIPFKINEIGPQEDFVKYNKPKTQDAPIDRQIKHDLERLLEANSDAFAEDERQIGTTPLVTMSIDTGDNPPIAKRPYTLAIKHHEWVKDEIDKLLEAGVIRESLSSWSAPIVVVPKADGGKRLVVDYRGLNNITRQFIWPMPRVQDIFAKLGKAKYFTTLDLRAGYHHLALDKDAVRKTAFCTPFGKYEWLKVPFGLAQAPAYFQKLMNKVLNGLNFAFAYLDDIIIFSESAEQHLKHIEIVLARLRQAQLKLKKSKCLFFKKELHYLGHLLTTDGIKPQREKIKAIQEMKPPKNPKGVREFLGMVGYYRKFISRFADAARPMTKLTRKDCKFEWTADCQKGFEYLTSCLIHEPILKYPDPNKRYVIFTDASDQAASAVLTQEYPDADGSMKEMPIAYLSAQFSDTQFKWSTIVKEGYAIYYAIKKWRHYLEDSEILLKSDAKSLEKFLMGKTDNLKLDRWSLELQGRNIQVQHIPSYKNKAADCLSRLPFVTRKRNDNPLKSENISLNEVKEDEYICCPICEVEWTDTKALQQNDKHCKRIDALMKDPKSKFHERESYGYDDNGLLYHVNRENGKEYKATVIPKELIKTILSEMHDHFGHFGVGKTYSLIKRYYYWPKMIKHIQAHVDSCSLCRREKLQADKYQLQTTEIPNRPFGKVSMDLIVDLPTSHQGNNHILVMVDHLTSWPIAVAIPSKDQHVVARAIYSALISQHANPEILLADNGGEFKNETLAYVCETFGIKQSFTSPHTPRSNGKTENFNKFLKASIRKLCQADKACWDQVLDQILLAYRCCPHTSTGEAPFTLVYNRDPPLPIKELIKTVEPYRGENSLGKGIEQSRVALTMAAKMLEKMRENQKRHYLNRRSVHKFKVGDLVLLKKHQKEKMDLKWDPNYRVVKLTSAWSAIVENQLTGKTRRCNVGDLKHKHPDEDWTLQPCPIGRAAKFVNHPDNLPDIDFKPEILKQESKETEPDKQKYSLRKTINAPNKLDL